MKTYPGIYNGDLTIREPEASFTGICSGDLHIAPGAKVALIGIVSGNLRIAQASVFLKGIVQGDVFNDGGDLNVVSIVGGSIHHRGRQPT